MACPLSVVTRRRVMLVAAVVVLAVWWPAGLAVLAILAAGPLGSMWRATVDAVDGRGRRGQRLRSGMQASGASATPPGLLFGRARVLGPSLTTEAPNLTPTTGDCGCGCGGTCGVA